MVVACAHIRHPRVLCCYGTVCLSNSGLTLFMFFVMPAMVVIAAEGTLSRRRHWKVTPRSRFSKISKIEDSLTCATPVRLLY